MRYFSIYESKTEKSENGYWVIKDKVITMPQEGYKVVDRCRLCGKYILKDEKYVVVCPPEKYRSTGKKYLKNFIVHYDEWVKFCEGVPEEELASLLMKTPQPHKPQFTDEQIERIMAFEQACKEVGYRIKCEYPMGLRMSKHKKRLAVNYNVYYDMIEWDKNNKEMVFSPVRKIRLIMNDILFKKENCIW